MFKYFLQIIKKWYLKIILQRRYNTKISDKSIINGNVVSPYYVDNKSCIFKIGHKSQFRGFLTFEDNNAMFEIGDNSSIGGQSIISCAKSIKIGNNVLISFDCKIFDHNSHSMDINLRMNDLKNIIEGKGKDWSDVKKGNVKIEDNVWIGAGVIILPGVSIGKNSILGAGSVVTKSIPENSIAAGNPAKVIKNINE